MKEVINVRKRTEACEISARLNAKCDYKFCDWVMTKRPSMGEHADPAFPVG
jgi:hypothetical protein